MNIGEAKAVWQKFISEGTLNEKMQPVVAKSWLKCRKMGVNPYSDTVVQVDDLVFQKVLKKNKELIRIAAPIIQSVYQIIKESHFLLVLTDRDGYVLETIGDDSILKKSENILFHKGAVWTNLGVGSNAPGIALEYDVPIQMNGPEHYCISQHGWTCSAAPIHGLNGQVIGCLDLSGAVEAAHPHTLALVVAGAFSVESMLASYHQTLLMRSAANGLHESILLLNDNFQLCWINNTAKRELSLCFPKMAMIDFRSVMPDVDWDSIITMQKENAPLYIDDIRFLIKGKVRRFSATISLTVDTSGRTITVILRKQEHLIRSVNRVSGNQAAYDFDSIFTADTAMKQVIERARQYARYDGSILIEGESGTGKELFAQAIHTGSCRAEGPFVAVNCASLPRDLIESELFGYEKGAFTGALKEGNPGKFELADHGTLFLDEIGEMPLEFQAKLLRVVETLRVRRIGGKEEKKLDVRVIAATNRNLRRQVQLGLFRGYLYYRLNVLRLDIPPLRERPDDIEFCANRFLQRFNLRYPDRKRRFSADFLLSLKHYDWPGNVRELQNSIERVFYTSESPVISSHDFCYVMDDVAAVVPSETREESEKQTYVRILKNSGGNVADAAHRISVSIPTFYRICKQYDIIPKKIRRGLE